MFTQSELKQRQSWTLEQKIDHSVGVISVFLERLNGQGYVSFSGGKDSTVLLDIARRFVKKDIPAVFCNTGNEFPEIIRFVKSVENVTIIRPKYTPKQIIEKYGFPLISKEQCLLIRQAKHTKSEYLRNVRLNGKIGRNGKPIGAISKCWQFLVNEQFNVSEMCCHYLKKEPLTRHGKETGLHPIIGTQAYESRLRARKWLNTGCNSFDSKLIASYPLSIWLESDIWAYIKKFNLPYSDIYDKGLDRTGCMFCGFGCTAKGDNRFTILNELKPNIYKMFMDMENNGIKYRYALKRIGVELPDERIDLFNQYSK